MKANKLFTAMASLVAAAALTACSNDEADFQQPVTAKSGVISLTSQLAQTRATSDPQTTQLNTAVKVGAFGVSGETVIANGDNNQYSVESNAALTAATEMVWPKEGSVSIYAYAPYQEGWASGTANAFSVATDQTTEAGYLKSDLVYGVPAQNPVAQTEDAIALNFTHKLSKLNVTIQKEEGAEIDLSAASVSITGTKVATTLNPSTGAVGEATGDAADIKAIASLGTGTTACAVIVPQQVAAGTELVKIIAEGKQLVAKLGTAVTFESGKAYNFTAKVNKNEVILTLGSTTLTDWDNVTDLGEGDTEESELEPITLTATFQTPGNNASYSAPTYTWTGSTSNLMTIFEFANGELAQYHTLKFTFSNLVDGPVRMGYYVDNTFTEFGNGFYSAGEKTVDLTALGIDLSTVTKIVFGGKSNAGSCDILATDVVLIGNGDGSATAGNDDNNQGGNDDNNQGGNDDNNQGGTGDGNQNTTLAATFGTPGGNASYSASTYTWTATNNNLMTCFEFSNGELANYTKLTFKISNLTSGTMVRMGYYVGSTFTEFGNGYGSDGTKEVDLTTLGIDLSTVTKIAFGGRTGTGSVDIVASDVVLSK